MSRIEISVTDNGLFIQIIGKSGNLHRQEGNYLNGKLYKTKFAIDF
jgi:hypothetical protein